MNGLNQSILVVRITIGFGSKIILVFGLMHIIGIIYPNRTRKNSFFVSRTKIKLRKKLSFNPQLIKLARLRHLFIDHQTSHQHYIFLLYGLHSPFERFEQ